MKIKCPHALFLLLFLGLLSPGTGIAQQGSEFDPVRDEISSRIPPLQTLIDTAIARDPYVKFRNLQLIINECKLRASQYDWTRSLGIQFNLGYGNFYNYSSSATTGVTPHDVATNRSETKYNGAFYIYMPLYMVIGRRSQIILAKTEIEQSQNMAEVQRNETRQLVIRQYNDLILKQRLFKLKLKYLETARINLQIVEKEFTNGVIAVTEYTRISEIVSRAEADYEGCRIDFLTAYMVLEEVVHIKFNIIK